MKRPEYNDRVTQVLAHIRDRQQQPGGTNAPEGYCEMHTYHVWEVLNALDEMRPTHEARKPHENTMIGRGR